MTFIPRRFTAFVLRQFLPFLRPPTVCRQILPPHQLGEPGRLQMLAVERSRTREVALASAPKWYNSARSGGTKQTDGARKRGFRVSEQVLGPSGIPENSISSIHFDPGDPLGLDQIGQKPRVRHLRLGLRVQKGKGRAASSRGHVPTLFRWAISVEREEVVDNFSR